MEDDEYLEAKDSYITGKKPHHRDCNPQLQEMPVAKEIMHTWITNDAAKRRLELSLNANFPYSVLFIVHRVVMSVRQI